MYVDKITKTFIKSDLDECNCDKYLMIDGKEWNFVIKKCLLFQHVVRKPTVEHSF